MSTLKNLLKQYAVESGEIPEVPVAETDTGEFDDMLLENFDEDTDAVGQLDVAEDSDDIADQMDDIADRAETLAAPEADETVAAISAESMRREFQTVMTVNKLGFQASSFESAGSDKARLTGLARDARRVATLARDTRESILDYTLEGKWAEWWNGDKSKLKNANKALNKAVVRLEKYTAKFNDMGVIVSHNGIKRFMTRDGKKVNDMTEAVSITTKYLEHLHAAIVEGQAKIQEIATKLSRGNPASELKSLEHGNVFKALQDLDTSQGYLMGNWGVVKKNAGGGKVPSLSIPVYERTNDHKFSLGQAAKVVGGAIVEGLIYGAATAAANHNSQGGNAVQRAAIHNYAGDLSKSASSVVGTGGSYSDNVNKSKSKSAASFSELIHIAREVQDYSKFLEFRVSEDNVADAISDARKNKGDLDNEDRKLLAAACSELDATLSRLVRLRTIAYDQSLYMTVMMASVISDVVAKMD